MPIPAWNPADSRPERLLTAFDRRPPASARPFAGQPLATGYPFDLVETADALILEMVVPGVTEEQLQLSIEGTIPESAAQITRSWTRSIPRGGFAQEIALPARVVADEVEAVLRDGVLRLTMPKVPESRARTIAVS